MRQIGQPTHLKFRHLRTGVLEEKVVEDVVKRITRDEYGHNSSHSRKLIVVLHAPDTITIKPYLSRGSAMTVVANIGEVYKTLLTRRLLTQALEKARAKKAENKEVRARKARYAKERRFMDRIKKENTAHAR